MDLVVGRSADDLATVHCTHIDPCDLACPSRIRSTSDNAYMEDAVALGVRVLPRMRVARLEHDHGGRLTYALCMTDDGPRTVRGRTFIVAANGIGTPRLLLLLSASDRFPDGLANSSGLVGRNLMLHPYGRVEGEFDEPVGAWVSGEKAGIVSYEFYATRPERGFVRGLKLQLGGGPGAVATARGSVRGRPLPWGAGHHWAFEQSFDRFCGFTVCAEDLAEPENRIAPSSMQARRGAWWPRRTGTGFARPHRASPRWHRTCASKRCKHWNRPSPASSTASSARCMLPTTPPRPCMRRRPAWRKQGRGTLHPSSTQPCCNR